MKDEARAEEEDITLLYITLVPNYESKQVFNTDINTCTLHPLLKCFLPPVNTTHCSLRSGTNYKQINKHGEPDRKWEQGV